MILVGSRYFAYNKRTFGESTDCILFWLSGVGVEPITEATTNGNGVHRLFSRIFARCVTAPVSLQQAAAAVCSLCTDDKYKGSYLRPCLIWYSMWHIYPFTALTDIMRRFPDIMRRSAFTRTAMQSLDKQLWRSRISGQLSWGSTTPVYADFPVWVRVLGDYQGRRTQDQCPPSMVSPYASRKWYHFISNDEVRCQTNQPPLTEIIQARRLTLFGYIIWMDDNVDANQILTSSPSVYWKRPPWRPRMTWMKTVSPEPTTLEAVGNKWRYALVVVQAGEEALTVNQPVKKSLTNNPKGLFGSHQGGLA